MINHPQIKMIKGTTVRIEYVANGKMLRSRIGTIRSIGFKTVSVETLKGAIYQIQLSSIENVQEVKP